MARRPTLLLLFALVAAFCGAPAVAQQQDDPNELKRLSHDQEKLADQVRRLDSLLETLEEREREAGESARADLIRGARKQLEGAQTGGDLVQQIETIAKDLASLRGGAALESQAEVISMMQDLLDYLLENQRQEQIEEALRKATERVESLERLQRMQRKLLEQTRALERSEKTSESLDNEGREGLAQSQQDLSEQVEAMAEADRRERQSDSNLDRAADASSEAAEWLGAEPKQSEPGRESDANDAEGAEAEGDESASSDTEQDASEGETSESPQSESSEGESSESPPGEQSQSESQSGESTKGQEGSSESQSQSESQQSQQQQQQQQQQSPSSSMRPPEEPGENLDEAEDAQERALEALEEAVWKAREEQQQLAEQERKEALLDLMSEASRLLERHRKVAEPLRTYVDEHPEARPSRRDRVTLRQWSEQQASISEDTSVLFTEVDKRGADTVPFLLSTLQEDHLRLSESLGSPVYEATEIQLRLADSITVLWVQFIDAMRKESERERPMLNQDGQPQDSQEQQDQGEPPLVGLAVEVQLLKELELQMQQSLEQLAEERRLLDDAGVELDESDRREIERLLERQARLRSIFEAIVKRLESEQQTEEDA